MFGMLLRLIFRPIGMMLLGPAAIALGISFLLGDPAVLPEKASLQQVSGVLDSATKITKKRRRTGTSVNYELEMKDASGNLAKFSLPEREIDEATVKNLLGAPLSILYSSERDVWELSSAGRKVIEYEATKAKRKQDIEDMAAAAPDVVGGGLLTLLGGIFWWRRRGSL